MIQLGGNALAKLLSELVGRIATFLLSLAIANVLGERAFGAYNYALALAFVLAQLADLGLQVLAARDRTRAGPTAPPEGLYFVAPRYPDFPQLPLERPGIVDALERHAVDDDERGAPLSSTAALRPASEISAGWASASSCSSGIVMSASNSRVREIASWMSEAAIGASSAVASMARMLPPR